MICIGFGTFSQNNTWWYKGKLGTSIKNSQIASGSLQSYPHHMPGYQKRQKEKEKERGREKERFLMGIQRKGKI